MKNDILKRDNIDYLLLNWLKINSVELPFELKHAQLIVEYVNEIDLEIINNDELWLSYFLDMNFSSNEAQRLVDFWDYHFLSEKLRFKKLGLYNDILFQSLLESAKRGIHESAINFVNGNFFYILDVLDTGYKSVIRELIEEYEEKQNS